MSHNSPQDAQSFTKQIYSVDNQYLSPVVRCELSGEYEFDTSSSIII